MEAKINNIINNYLNNNWSYSKFSYEITPLLWDAIDGEIKNEEIRLWLIGIFNILEDFCDDEFFSEYNLKSSLKCMIKG